MMMMMMINKCPFVMVSLMVMDLFLWPLYNNGVSAPFSTFPFFRSLSLTKSHAGKYRLVLPFLLLSHRGATLHRRETNRKNWPVLFVALPAHSALCSSATPPRNFCLTLPTSKLEWGAIESCKFCRVYRVDLRWWDRKSANCSNI